MRDGLRVETSDVETRNALLRTVHLQLVCGRKTGLNLRFLKNSYTADAQEVSSSQTRNGTAELQRPGSACETNHSTQLQQGNFLYTTAVHTGEFAALASKSVYGMHQAKPKMHVQHA